MEEEDGGILARMELDTDSDTARVDTGTWDQPVNAERSQFPNSSERV